MAPARPHPRSRSASTCPTTEPTRLQSRSQSTTTRYAHLAPHSLHISRTKILKKWKPLPLSTQDRIRQALLDVRDASKARRRKILPKPKNGNAAKTAAALTQNVISDEDWEGAIDEVVEKLISRLPRMPFPPQHQHSHSSAKTTAKATASSTDLDFSLERILERTSSLRATLSANSQSVRLLKAQIKREEKALRRDRGELKGLEEGVRRGREVEGREKRGLHAVARDLDVLDEEGVDGGRVLGRGRMGMSKDEDEDMMDSLLPTAARTRLRKAHVALTNEAIENDTDLAPLVKQLRSHLGSMQSNVAGMHRLRKMLGSAESMVTRFNAKALGA